MSSKQYFAKTSDVVSFLEKKFDGLKLNIKEVDPDDLKKPRLESKMQRYETVRGSAKFQVLFSPQAAEASKLVLSIASVSDAAMNMGVAVILKNLE